MGLTIILFSVGPFVVLTILGAISIYLTFTGFFPGRAHYGWALLGISFTVFFGSVVINAGAGEIGFETVFSLVYVLFLSAFLALQGPLVLEMISLTVIPDPSKGLKPLKVHTEAEKKVVEDDLPGAIAEYERIITEDPEDYDARFRLAELCCENQEYRKAATVYEEVLKLAEGLSVSQRCSALTRLSEIYASHLGDVNNARRCIRTIIESHPDTKYAGYAEDRLSNL